jgi:hypothetical protein
MLYAVESSVYAQPQAQEAAVVEDDPLATTQHALQEASAALQRATYQGNDVQRATVNVKLAINDIAAGIAFAGDHPDGSASPAASATKPDFNPPARPAPNRNVNMEMALASLKTAFEAFAKVHDVNFGEFRTKANDDIAAAASDVITAIQAANAQWAARGRGRGAPPTVPPGR